MAADRRAAQERLSDLQQRITSPAAAAAAAAAAPGTALGLGAALEGAVAPAAAVAAPAAAPPAARGEELVRLAEAARRAGQGTFTWPAGVAGGRVGTTIKLYYDRARGPLSRDARPRIKAGLNKWEEILLLDMRRADVLVGLDGQDWWEADVQLPEELFQ
jgi:hypothetical protein